MATLMANDNDLGWRVKVLREALDLTQEELALRAGMSRQTLINLESGDVESKPSTVQLVCMGLEVDERELRYGDIERMRQQFKHKRMHV